jgi:hypothetical protein
MERQMNRAPKIGERVRYDELCFSGEPFEERRTVTGTVMAIYEDWNEAGTLLPEREWSAGIKVDEKPKWWAYGNNDRFAPAVAHLEPIK